MAEKIKVANFEKKNREQKTKRNLRKLLHVRKKAFFIRNREPKTKKKKN